MAINLSSNPSIGIKIVSLFFIATGIILFIGLISAFKNIPFEQENYQIFLVHTFLSLLCFFVAFGIYKHKKWAFWVGFSFGLYLILNFLINLKSSFPLDLILAGVPIIILINVVLLILHKKRKHFIN